MPGVSFDRAVRYYDATRGYAPGVAEHIRDAIVAKFALTSHDRVLELGVGTGRIALPFIQAGYRYVGSDISTPMMSELTWKLERDPHERQRPALCCADAVRLPFVSAAFALVVAVHVIHLVDGWQHMVREVQRVVQPGGSLMLGYDEGVRDMSADRAPQAAIPVQQTMDTWNRILDDLGYSRSHGQPGVRPTDPRVAALLHELGATTETVELATYRRPAISPRKMLEQFRDRIYSSHWAMPDDTHAEATQRLTQWIEHDCPAPDQAVAAEGHFVAVVARW